MKYKDKINIIYIDPKKEHILAARFNVFSVPTFVFYNKNGKEQSRENRNHSIEQVELRLSEIK
jgi:thiol:disulfide interchange protein